LEYDPVTKETKVLIAGLVFANGVTLSNEEDCITQHKQAYEGGKNNNKKNKNKQRKDS